MCCGSLFVSPCCACSCSRPLQLFTNIGLVRSLSNLPFVGPVLAPVLLPPVSVQAVAEAAVDAALARPKPEKSVIEVDDILKHEA